MSILHSRQRLATNVQLRLKLPGLIQSNSSGREEEVDVGALGLLTNSPRSGRRSGTHQRVFTNVIL